MIKVGIVGISGYSGGELLKILLGHAEARVTYVSANHSVGPVDELWPHLAGRTKLVCAPFNVQEAADNCELIFLAVPHKIAMQITPSLLERGLKVIDLSGDYRLDNAIQYKKWYGVPHTDIRRLKKAVYGLPELYREDIKKADLVANPGCYPTASLLGLLPVVSTLTDKINLINIDAKSGVSGAGRKAAVALNYVEVNENTRAYKVLNHQHAPEIELYLSKVAGVPIQAHFVPHLLPVNRGILATTYVYFSEKMVLTKMHQLYKRFYKLDPFVRLCPLGQQPELKHVTGTNYCDMGLALSADRHLLVVTSVIDNLVKGAAGQAVQNMNLMCGFNEIEGLV